MKFVIGAELLYILGAKYLLKRFPDVTMLTSEVHEFCPSHFGQKYFGAD